MARKKKTKTQSTTTNNDINTKSVGLVYQGQVSISYRKNNKVLKTIKTHNVGCKPIMEYITHCLGCTDVDGLNERNPRILHICHWTDDGTHKPSFIGDVDVMTASVSQRYEEDLINYDSTTSPDGYAQSSLTFTWLISGKLIQSNILGNLLAIYSENGEVARKTSTPGSNKPMAYIILEPSQCIINVPNDTTLEIKWKMKISNAVSKS